MKSRAMCDQGQRGMGSSCSSPAGGWWDNVPLGAVGTGGHKLQHVLQHVGPQKPLTGQGALEPWMVGEFGHTSLLENVRAERHSDKQLLPRFAIWGWMLASSTFCSKVKHQDNG